MPSATPVNANRLSQNCYGWVFRFFCCLVSTGVNLSPRVFGLLSTGVPLSPRVLRAARHLLSGLVVFVLFCFQCKLDTYSDQRSKFTTVESTLEYTGTHSNTRDSAMQQPKQRRGRKATPVTA